MKKLLFLSCLIFLFVFSLQAQVTSDYAEFKEGFEAFADGVSQTLPSIASIGLNWSPAYIGKLPHFGVGATVGFATIPYENMETIFGTLGVDLSDMEFLETMGIPMPAAVIDARLGGFLLPFPFDLGFKIGFIPGELKGLLPIDLDYLMIGGDFRYPLVKERFLIPSISVGLGYTFYRGGVGIPDLMGTGDTGIEITEIMNLAGYGVGPHILTLTAPGVAFDWRTHTFEAKAQLSKRILLLTFNVGLGLGYGISRAGGGLKADVNYTDGGLPADLQDVKDVFDSLGYMIPTSTGILVESAASGPAIRVFGGVSLNLLFLWVDLNAMYNILSGSYGAAANVRIQF